MPWQPQSNIANTTVYNLCRTKETVGRLQVHTLACSLANMFASIWNLIINLWTYRYTQICFTLSSAMAIGTPRDTGPSGYKKGLHHITPKGSPFFRAVIPFAMAYLHRFTSSKPSPLRVVWGCQFPRHGSYPRKTVEKFEATGYPVLISTIKQ